MSEKIKPKNVKMPKQEFEDLEMPEFKFKKKKDPEKIKIIEKKKMTRENALF